MHVERKKKIYLINYLNAGPHFSLMQIQAGPAESVRTVPKKKKNLLILYFQTQFIKCMDYAINIFKTHVERENKVVRRVNCNFFSLVKMYQKSKRVNLFLLVFFLFFLCQKQHQGSC